MTEGMMAVVVGFVACFRGDVGGWRDRVLSPVV
jgi:hypothetical protein